MPRGEAHSETEGENTGEGSRTPNLLIRGQDSSFENKGLTEQGPHSGPHKSAGMKPDTPTVPVDPELAELAQVWPTLPGALRAAVLGLVRAAGGGR